MNNIERVAVAIIVVCNMILIAMLLLAAFQGYVPMP